MYFQCPGTRSTEATHTKFTPGLSGLALTQDVRKKEVDSSVAAMASTNDRLVIMFSL